MDYEKFYKERSILEIERTDKKFISPESLNNCVSRILAFDNAISGERQTNVGAERVVFYGKLGKELHDLIIINKSTSMTIFEEILSEPKEYDYIELTSKGRNVKLIEDNIIYGEKKQEDIIRIIKITEKKKD